MRPTRLLPVLAALVALAGCGGHPPPKPPTPPTAPTWTLTINSVPEGALITAVDGPTKDLCTTPCSVRVQQQGFTIRAHKDGYVDPPWQGVTLTSDLTRTFTLEAVPTLQAVHADGHVFRTADGRAWRYKGVSAFALLRRFEVGQDISDTLNAYKNLRTAVCNDESGCRFNVLRVWTYTPTISWGARAWPFPADPQTVVRFLRRVEKDGWYVELTLLTDSDPSRVPQAKALVATLKAAAPKNLLLEIGNEPEVQTAPNRNYDTSVLRSTLEGSGFQFASGNYTNGAQRWFGTFLTTHTKRDVEWPRRSHDCFDYWAKPWDSPAGAIAVHAPCVLDEPPKPTSSGLGGSSKTDDWRAYFGSAGQFSAGATFHSETGLDGKPPTAAETELAQAALEGLNAFTASTPTGGYRCLTCEAGKSGDSLRTYIFGGTTMVRIRPNSPNAPEPGWTSLDGGHVLWKK